MFFLRQGKYTFYPPSFSIPFPKKYHLLQTYNDCGPYSVTAVINTVSDRAVSVERIKKEMKWRLKNNYALPFGLESLLRKYGIQIRTHILAWKSETEKINFLKYHLSRGRMVILLGNIQNTPILHYLTLLGYNKDNFYCYDSFQKTPGKREKGISYTIDDRNQTGNRTLSRDELLGFWNKGGYAFCYRNYCIVIHSKREENE